MTDPPRTLATYLDEVAAGTPAPGGGSVTAVVAALAAALGAMVAGLTVGRERYADSEETLQLSLSRLTVLRERLLEAAAADERAYAAFRSASALPRRSDAQKIARAAAMHEALIAATEVPLDVARAAAEIAEILMAVASLGSPHVRSDAALGALLAEAALRGALLNVRGNAALMREKSLVARYLAAAERLEQAGREASRRAYRAATEDSTGSDFR